MASAVAASHALAQPSQLATLKAADSLTAQDVQTIRRWIDQQVTRLLQAETPARLRQASRAFAEAYAGATQAFQTAFAKQCAEAFAAHVLDSQTSSRAAMIMLRTVVQQGRGSAIGLLTKALGSNDMAVRFWAAKGLANLRQHVATSQQPAKLIEQLKQAGIKEPCPCVLRQIYAALNLTSASGNLALAGQVGRAIVAILNGQLPRHARLSARPGSAEVTALKVLGPLLGQLDPTLRREAVAAVAKLLYYALLRYQAEPNNPWRRRDPALLIEQAETFLRQAVQAHGQTTSDAMPDVLAKLKAGKADEARAELTKWIGSPDRQGLLNRLFGLAPGAGLGPLSPATTAAAAKGSGQGD